LAAKITPLHARVVLLDWDGTQLDSYAADFRAFMAMFRALEIEWGGGVKACAIAPIGTRFIAPQHELCVW